MQNSSLARSHRSLSLASDAFSRGIARALEPADRRDSRLVQLIIARSAIDSELMLLDGAVRTLARGNARRVIARARSLSAHNPAGSARIHQNRG